MTAANIAFMTPSTGRHSYKQHVESMYDVRKEAFFERFKQKIETDSENKLTVMPRTRKYKMAIFDTETGVLQAYFNYAAETNAKENSWRVVPSNTYLNLVLPYYNRGTYHYDD